MSLIAILSLSLLISLLLLFRLLAVLPIHRTRPHKRSHDKSPAHVLVVLGSGGHTAEMLALLRNLDTSRYKHRTYLVSSGDLFSTAKAREFESSLSSINSSTNYGGYNIVVVPRARHIHQGLLTTPFSCAQSLFGCLRALRSHRTYPDLIVTNGPATAVIAILAALLVKFVAAPGIEGKMRTIYVESWARVRRLSLSGRILVWCVDRFLVQWETLLPATHGRGEYLGVLIE